MTIRSCLEQHAAERPQLLAMKYFADGAWQTRTYGEFLAGVKAAAAAYGTKFTLRPQRENVSLILANGPTWMEAYLACAGAGVSVVPVDPKLRENEVAYILADSAAVVVTTDKAHLEMLTAIKTKLPALRAVVIVDGGAQEYPPIGDVPVYDYETLKAGGGDAAWFEKNVAKEDDTASIIYTSGTTGKPKGAMLTHANFTEDAKGGLAAFDERVDETDSFFIVLPLFHAFSFLGNFVLPIWRGSAMYFNRSLRQVSEDIRQTSPTLILAVPLLAEKVYEKIEKNIKNSKLAQFLIKVHLGALVTRGIKKGLGGKLRFMVAGGAPCPVHVLAGFKKLGILMFEGYGLTECAPVVSVAGTKCAKIGTIGHKLPNIDVRLADQNNQGVGELQVKGPVVMKGYFHNEEATREAFDGEWFRTGDLASMDADGLITIRGRKKALIVNREGKNIYPEEVENAIAGDPIIADVVVVGYHVGKDPGEHVGVIVHPDEDILTARNGGKPMDWKAIEHVATFGIRTRCNRLADYKRPRKILVVHEPLERTSIQKVRRVAYKGMLDEQ